MIYLSHRIGGAYKITAEHDFLWFFLAEIHVYNICSCPVNTDIFIVFILCVVNTFGISFCAHEPKPRRRTRAVPVPPCSRRELSPARSRSGVASAEQDRAARHGFHNVKQPGGQAIVRVLVRVPETGHALDDWVRSPMRMRARSCQPAPEAPGMGFAFKFD